MSSIINSIFSSFLTTTFPCFTTIAPPPPPAAKIPPSSSTCAVCLSTIGRGWEMANTKILPCLHEFHAACIDRWLSAPHAKNTCPVCRYSIGGDRDDGKSGFKRHECFTEEMVIWFSSFHVAGF
ncbi:E3 ubiquitin-protein ligase MPSR1-like [Andrographis paniculata]|uniref:E3 ubiquitin-protein ligase MPSR1-like n=1 Tax=Andrographis paniculata TaxID=175694 RepID=UPI0021E9382D|nr:E3 ubiquitin-protein ligase MPSR1-like [Andrographis paniculata]